MNPDRPTFNEYSQIRRMALRAPEEAFCQQQAIDEQWERLHYYGKPDFEEALEEHRGLREILSGEGIDSDIRAVPVEIRIRFLQQ